MPEFFTDSSIRVSAGGCVKALGEVMYLSYLLVHVHLSQYQVTSCQILKLASRPQVYNDDSQQRYQTVLKWCTTLFAALSCEEDHLSINLPACLFAIKGVCHQQHAQHKFMIKVS